MKKVKFMLLLTTIGLFAGNSQAQGFGGQGSKYIQLGLGVSQHFSHYDDYYGKYRNNYEYGGFYFQMEFGIHKYVGLGFGLGAELGLPGGKYSPAPGVTVAYGNPYRHFGIPVYFMANFHFLQLIADKNGKNFADKLDVYGGLNVGGGPDFYSVRDKYKNGTYYYDNGVGLLYFFGPHVGCRFFPKENVGIYAELGYGKQLGNLGVVFKL